METWQWAELGIDFGAPGGLALAGLWFVFGVGLRKWRRKPARRCLKCGYDMRGSEGLVCVECGWEGKSQREVEHGRLRRGWVAAGLLICLPAVWLAGFWIWYAPEALARQELDRRRDADGGIRDQDVMLDWYERDPKVNDLDRMVRISLFNRMEKLFTGKEDVFGEKSNEVLPATAKLTLDPHGEMMWQLPSTTALHFHLRYVLHQWLYPARHYAAYLPYRDAAYVHLRGTKKNVASDEQVENLGQFTEAIYLVTLDVMVDDRVMEKVGKFKSLEALQIHQYAASPQKLAKLQGMSGLRELWLEFERPVQPEDVMLLAEIGGLKELGVVAHKGMEKGCDAALAQLVNALSLTYLHLQSDVENEVGGGLKLPAAIAQCKTLTGLTTDVDGWQAAEIEALKGLTKLKSLTLRSAAKKKPGAGQELAWMESLGLDKKALGVISGLEGVTGMGLVDCEFSNEDWEGFVFPKSVNDVTLMPWAPRTGVGKWVKEGPRLWRITADDMPKECVEFLAGRGGQSRVEIRLEKTKLTYLEIIDLKQRYPRVLTLHTDIDAP